MQSWHNYSLWYCSFGRASALWEDNGNDESIQSESFCEDEDQDHTNEDGFLLSVCSYSCVSYNSDGKSGCEWWKTTTETWGQVLVSEVISVSGGVDFADQDNWDDQAIDTQYTSHNDWYDWFENEFRLQDTHASNTNSTLSCTVGGTKVSKD